jgi:hypothetical protein
MCAAEQHFFLEAQQPGANPYMACCAYCMLQIAYGNILAEDPAGLAPRHFRQLLLLGQACLDYLWAICMETSRSIVSSSCLVPGILHRFQPGLLLDLCSSHSNRLHHTLCLELPA